MNSGYFAKGREIAQYSLVIPLLPDEDMAKHSGTFDY